MARKAKNKDGTPSDVNTGEKASEQTRPKARRQRAKRRIRSATRSLSRSQTGHARKAARPSRRGRVRYSDAERQKILGTAKREGLTGAQVHDRFGVSTLTYYSWRKKAGTTRSRRSGRAAGRNDKDFTDQLREAVRAKVREMLPQIIGQEIGASLGEGRRRGR